MTKHYKKSGLKFYLFFIGGLILTSCQAVHLPVSETTINNLEQDTLVDGRYIKVKMMDGREALLAFDTGATISALNDINLIGGDSILTDKNHKKINVKGATKLFSSIKVNLPIFNTRISKTKNAHIVIYQLPKKQFPCIGKLLLQGDGVLGLNAFSEADPSPRLLLSYQDSIIKIIPKDYKIPAKYKLVNAEFKKTKIFVYGDVQGEKVKFLFDTGDRGYVNVASKEIFDGQKPYKEINGLLGEANNSFSNNTYSFYKNKDFQVEGLGEIHPSLITVIDGLDGNTLGLSFIQNYNWIIDFRHKKLYAQKIKDFDLSKYEKAFKTIRQVALAMNDKLIVVYSQNPKYPVGKIITNVDGKKVTSENVCSLQEFLNNQREKDWDKLDIKIE